MPKKVLGAQFSEAELRAREAAALADMKAKRKPVAVDPNAMKGFEGKTRHQIAQFMARERMRMEAEQTRGNKARAADAKANMNAAKEALRYLDTVNQ